jgi:integrating conjugative element protein (TIGR03749 family)
MNQSYSIGPAVLKWTCFVVASLASLLPCQSGAVEIRHWERLPLPVTLIVGQERVIFIDRNVRVGVPSSLSERLRVQSAGGAIYVRASAPIEATRIQLQDADSGALILLDVSAMTAKDGQVPLEPLRIFGGGEDTGGSLSSTTSGGSANTEFKASASTPMPVSLTRYAAQSLYAPLRTVEPLPGVSPVSTRAGLPLDTLLPSMPLRASIAAAWRLGEWWVTAVRITNTGKSWLPLDPRTLQGDFVAATFQHPDVGPAGTSFDTTVLYLVTRAHGLAESLVPRVSQIDPAANLPGPVQPDNLSGDRHEK